MLSPLIARREGHVKIIMMEDKRDLPLFGGNQGGTEGSQVGLNGDEHVAIRRFDELKKRSNKSWKALLLDRLRACFRRKRRPQTFAFNCANQFHLRKLFRRNCQAMRAHRGVGREIVAEDGEFHRNLRYEAAWTSSG